MLLALGALSWARPSAGEGRGARKGEPSDAPSAMTDARAGSSATTDAATVTRLRWDTSLPAPAAPATKAPPANGKGDLVCSGQRRIADWASIRGAIDQDPLFQLARRTFGAPLSCAATSSGAGETRDLQIRYLFADGSRYESHDSPPENLQTKLLSKKLPLDEAAVHTAVEAIIAGKLDWQHPSDDGSGKPAGPNDDLQFTAPDVNGGIILSRRAGRVVGVDVEMNL